jgi:hypothetical protein
VRNTSDRTFQEEVTMSEVFHVSGRLVWLDGVPVAGSPVFLVDQDLLVDDLIAVMVTDEDGIFRASFAREAFNQDIGEREAHPDLYLVVHRLSEGRMVSVRRLALPPSEERVRELGTLTVPLISEVRFQRDKVPVRRLVRKVARRVTLEPALLRDLVQEMAEEVGELTGWRGLERDVELRVVDDIGKATAELLAAQCEDGRFDAERRRLASNGSSTHAASYEVGPNVILFNRRFLEAQGLAALRVATGHELVHVGQYRAHPELRLETLQRKRALWQVMPLLVGALLGEPVQASELRALVRLMRTTQTFKANLEGYASYIDSNFLGGRSHTRFVLPHLGPIDRLMTLALDARLRRAAVGPPPQELAALVSFDVYTNGRLVYEQRQRGERPAPFDPSLRIPPPAR